MKNKVVFLDFDGVVRIIPSLEDDERLIIPAPEFDRNKLQMLAEWCRETGAVIVVSSDLRKIDTYEGTSNQDEVFEWLSAGISSDLIHDDWATPIAGPRWKEIMRWLSHHPEVIDFVIIDDFRKHFEDAPPMISDRIVYTNNRFGLLPVHKDPVFTKLNHANNEKKPILGCREDFGDSDL